MATGRGSSTARAAPTPEVQNNAPRRPSLALQPFPWGGLQILPVAPTATELVAVVPPPLPGLHRTAPFRVSEYDERCRIAVMALEAALGPGELADAEVASPWATGGLDLDLDEDLRTVLDLSDLAVPLPPSISRACGNSIGISPGCETERVPPNLRPSGSPCGRIAAGTRTEGTATAAEPDHPAEEMRTPPVLPPPQSAGEAVPAASTDKLEEKSGGFKQESSSGGSPTVSNVMAAAVAGSCGEHQGARRVAGASCQNGAGPQRQDVLGRGRVPEAGPGCEGGLSHQQGGAVAHGPYASPSEISNLKATGPAQLPAHGHRRPPVEHETQGPQKLFQQPLENHQPMAQDDGERPAKRRRAAPAWLRKDYQLSPLQLSPQEVAVAAIAAGAGEGKTGDQQPRHEPRTQRAERGTGKCVKAKGHPQQPLGNGTAAVKDDVQNPGPPSCPSGRVGGVGGNGKRASEVGAGGPQQQLQDEEEEKEKQALAWWDSLLAAAPQLESLKRALQAVLLQPPPRGGANGKRQGEDQMQNAGESSKDGIVDAEERELQEEVERGERARQRWLAGEYVDLHVDEGPTGARQRQHATVAGTDHPVTLTCGAYGPAIEAAGSSGWQRCLPAAAAAALERIQLAVNGPPQLPPLTVGLRGGRPGSEDPAHDQQLQGGAEPVDPSLKDEVVLWVVVCGPGQPHVLHEEYLVLGSQCLSDLRDVLGCATEDAMRQAAQVAQVPMPGTAAACDEDGGCGAAGKGRARNRGGSNGGSGRPLEAAAAGEAATSPSGGPGGPTSRRRGRGRGRAEARLPPLNSAVRAGHSDDGAVTAAAAAAVAGGDENRNAGNPAALAGSPPLPLGSSVQLLPLSYGSYLFLEGHFYTDVRHPDAEDYTAPIRELCSAHGVRPTYLRPERSWRPALVRHDGGTLPPPKPMHTTRFSELTLRQANHPTGIFCHRACCEHLMFMRDVRRWHPGDPADRSAFPVRLRTRDRAGAPVTRRRCSVCEARYAELVTHDDPLAPSNPAVMCRHCFDLLHFGSNGERLAPNVIAQPYNPALDIATQGIWAPSAGAWTALNAPGDTSGGGGGCHNDNSARIWAGGRVADGAGRSGAVRKGPRR
ncbi:hypothetical protein VaNZ11_011995 [Volvox africanus]|uniref:snRNA transcription factor n=1 Tax=Volvox africanus TaxID=51714 RepID=A0ABQ5SCU4_9CHLO|nr:hypothetical protein VaNZ11_011995 [Volvox africanus]